MRMGSGCASVIARAVPASAPAGIPIKTRRNTLFMPFYSVRLGIERVSCWAGALMKERRKTVQRDFVGAKKKNKHGSNKEGKGGCRRELVRIRENGKQCFTVGGDAGREHVGR